MNAIKRLSHISIAGLFSPTQEDLMFWEPVLLSIYTVSPNTFIWSGFLITV